MKQQSIKKNFIYSSIYQIIQVISPLITAPYVSRVLGADGVGVYSYTSSLVSYFVMFAALGVLTYGNREIARWRDDMQSTSRLFWEIELVVVFFSLISLLLWFVFSLAYKQYTLYLLILSMQIIAVIFDISWFFSGLEMYRFISIKNSLFKIFSIVLIFIFVKNRSDLWIYILIMSLAILVGNLSMWTSLNRYLLRVPVKTLRFQNHIKQMAIYFLPTIATSVYTVMDKSLIGIITKNEAENGYYDQATKLINIAKSITFVAINSVMGSRASYLFARQSFDEVRRRIEETYNMIFIMGYALSFGIAVCAKWMVPWFFGPGFEPVILLLIMMAPVIVIIGISNCAGSLYYTPAGLQIKSTVFLASGSLVNLVMNLLLIPKLGSYGAVLGTLAAETVISLLYVHFSKGFVTWKQIFRLSWKRISAGLVMAGVILLFSWNREPSFGLTLIQVILGAFIYIGMLWILNDRFLKKYTRSFFSMAYGKLIK